MAKAPLEAGDVIAIPFGEKFAAAKTLYVSDHVKDVFGFVVFDRVFDSLDSISVEDGPYTEFAEGPNKVKLLHADRKNITRRKIWTVVGQLPVTEDDQELLRFGIGGTLYHGNDKIRVFSTVDERMTFPQVKTSGNKLVEIFLQQSLGS